MTRQLNSDSTQFSVPKSHLFRDFCLKPLFPRFLRDRLRPVARRLGWVWGHIPHWIDADFRLRFGLDARLRRESVKKSFPSRVQRHLYEVLLFNSNITSTLGEKDCLGSIFSAEYRYPFLDRRLVEFLIAIPEEQRWWMDRPKTILRRALRGILPE